MDVAIISSWVLLAINTITLITLIASPLRKKSESLKSLSRAAGERLDKQDEAIKCLLRESILRVYHENKDRRKLSQVQAEFISQTYKAYKGLNGNSFIDTIIADMREWEILK